MGCFKMKKREQEKRCENVSFHWVPGVFLSLRTRLLFSSFFFYLYTFSLSHSYLSFVDLKHTFLGPLFASQPPLTPTNVLNLPFLSLSLFHIFIPVASSPPSHRHTQPQRRCLTVPYVVFAPHCATTFFSNWIISLAEIPHLLLGGFYHFTH